MITGCWIDRWKGKEVSRVYVCVCTADWFSALKRERKEWTKEKKTLIVSLSSTIGGGSETYCGAPTVTSCHSILVGRKRQRERERGREWSWAGAGQNPDNTRLPLQFRSFSPTRHLTVWRRLLKFVLVKWEESLDPGVTEMCTSTWI